MGYAIASRRMQFEAGPETTTFYACEEHKPKLERGDVMCFFSIASEPVKPVSADDEIPCDYCREG